MKIKRSQAVEIANAIQQLDQPILFSSETDETTETKGDKSETKRNNKVVQRRLVFDGKVRCDLACNLRLLKDAAADTDSSRQGLFQQLSTEDNTVRESDGVMRLKGKADLDFQRQVLEMLGQEIDVPLRLIPLDALKLDVTPIPLNALSDLIGRVFIGPSENGASVAIP